MPLDRLDEAIGETAEIGRRHDLIGLSFGHAGDGNLHSTFLFSPESEDERARACTACEELVRPRGPARRLDLRRARHGLAQARPARKAVAPRAVELHEAVKQVFDPKGLLNPGKKLARLPLPIQA